MNIFKLYNAVIVHTGFTVFQTPVYHAIYAKKKNWLNVNVDGDDDEIHTRTKA